MSLRKETEPENSPPKGGLRFEYLNMFISFSLVALILVLGFTAMVSAYLIIDNPQETGRESIRPLMAAEPSKKNEATSTASSSTTTSTTSTTTTTASTSSTTTSTSATTSTTTTSTTTTTLCGNEWEMPCVNEDGVEKCEPGTTIGSKGLCQPKECAPSRPSGKDGCGSFALSYCSE